MWLIDSSIGRKLIMSITGLFLILFLIFHMSMNAVAIFSGEAYNEICGFLGAKQIRPQVLPYLPKRTNSHLKTHISHYTLRLRK